MIFGEHPHKSDILLHELQRKGVKHKPAPWDQVATVREEVMSIIACVHGWPKVRKIGNDLVREHLWEKVADQKGRISEPMPPLEGPVYAFTEHPGDTMAILEAKVARGLNFGSRDVFIAPVESRSWVWIFTHAGWGPYIVHNPAVW